MSEPKTCFVIMPFAPELHYFYLYLREHFQDKYRLQRADDQTQQVPFLDKIRDAIQKSDVIIADCTGNKPNVLYELGIAHALNKKVILITQDSAENIPSDIQHYDFILYTLDRHDEFLRKLDNALTNAFSDEQYEALYQRAIRIYDEFQRATGTQVELASQDVFVSLVKSAERTQGLPPADDLLALKEFVLPKIIANIDNALMAQIIAWLSQN